MDPALCRSGADVEGPRVGDDLRWQSYNHRFGCQHDRGGIRAGTSRNRFLGLRARWNSHHGPDDCRRYPCATGFALSNRTFCARAHRVPAGAVKALLRLWSIQTTVAGEQFASAQDGDTQQA